MSGPRSRSQRSGTVVYVLHMPGGKTYIGQPRVTGRNRSRRRGSDPPADPGAG